MLKLLDVNKSFQKRMPSGSKIKDIFSPKYEQFHALENISFEVKQGEKVAFIGPNGAGKSTTIKAILGILHIDSGSIEVFGMDPKKDRIKISKSIASVFGQRSQLLYHLPLMDSFEFFKVVYEIPQISFDERLKKLSENFKIQEFINTPVRKLSLGQRMKGEIIASLIHGPKAIFLDEPTVGLDIIAKKAFYETLLQIHKDENITLFLTSHDLKDVESLCERAIVINKGKIIYNDDLLKLHKTYGNKKIIKFQKYGKIDYETLMIENSPKVLKDTVSSLFEKYEIEDMQIENIPLEDIIENFYR